MTEESAERARRPEEVAEMDRERMSALLEFVAPKGRYEVREEMPDERVAEALGLLVLMTDAPDSPWGLTVQEMAALASRLEGQTLKQGARELECTIGMLQKHAKQARGKIHRVLHQRALDAGAGSFGQYWFNERHMTDQEQEAEFATYLAEEATKRAKRR